MKTPDAATAGSAPSGVRPYRRRTFVVKRAFQFRYAVIMFGLFGLAAFMVWWEIYSSFKSLIDQGLIHEPAALRMVGDASRVVFIKVAIALGLVWFLSLLLSHYLAGPIYRFEACLRELREGDLTTRARLRPYDELKSLASAYNETLDVLKGRIAEAKEASRNVEGKGAEALRRALGFFKV